VTVWAGGGDFFCVAAGVAEERVRVGVEGEGEETVGAEGLPAAFFAESERGGAAAVVIDEGLVAVLEVLLDGGKKRVGEVAVFGEGFAGGEVDNLDVGGDGGSFGFLGEGDEGVFGLGEIKVGDERGGGAKEARDVEGAGKEGSEADGGVFGGVFLVVSGFVGFVDDNEAEIVKWGEESGAGANDNAGGVGGEEVLPGEVAFGFGLFTVEQSDDVAKGGLEDLDKLGG